MDCHLLALKRIAEENDFGTPELFKDESYQISNQFTLSTSQVPTSMPGSFMCYGPVVPDGYGCSYNPKPDYILFVTTSFKSCKTTCSKSFADTLKQSLDDMYELCNHHQTDDINNYDVLK
jgi:choline O-acetyltransferase